MNLRRVGFAGAFGAAILLGAACSLNSDLDGYAGGQARDTGPDDAARDSVTLDTRDTATGDTGSPDSGGASDADAPSSDTGVADGADSGVSTDSAIADSGVTESGATDSGSDTGATDTSGEAGADGGTCHVVINEVLSGTSTTGTDEFVEIYNPCPTTLSVAGFKVVYRPFSSLPTSSDSSTLATLVGTLAPGGYLLIANKDGAFGKTPYVPDHTYAGGLAQTGGGVGLRDASLTLIDSVTWGDAVPTHPFTETKAKAPPTYTASPGTSIARKPNGVDTNDNSIDFVGQVSTPRAAN